MAHDVTPFLLISKTLRQLSFGPVHLLESVPGLPPGGLQVTESGRLDWRKALMILCSQMKREVLLLVFS